MNRSTQHAFELAEVMAYLDGELDPARAALLAGHLQHCDDCQALAAQFRQLSERLLDLSVEATPTNLSIGVLSAIESAEPPKKTTSREVDELVWDKLRRVFKSPLAWALVGTAAVALIVVGVHEANTPRYDRWLDEDVAYLKSSRSTAPADTMTDSVPASRGKTPSFRIENAEQATGVGEDKDGTVGKLEAPAPAGPIIAQTDALTIVAANYDEASAAVDRMAASQGGYLQKLTTSDHMAAAREFSATVRVPAAQLGGFLAELRKLGHVEQETRANEEVTDQYVDLQARLKSARASEERMLELLATRTGKLEDVLDAERELARIREEIESMEGQRVLLAHRVNYATVEVQLREEYREQLNPRSPSTKIWNATVEGLHNLEDGAVAALIFVLAYGPSTVLWLAIILVPAWFIWRRVR